MLLEEKKRMSLRHPFSFQERIEMTRREQREQVFKMLFRVEFHDMEDMLQ